VFFTGPISDWVGLSEGASLSSGDVERVGIKNDFCNIHRDIVVADGRREICDDKNKVRNMAGGGVK
jgi:hypothetical protein